MHRAQTGLAVPLPPPNSSTSVTTRRRSCRPLPQNQHIRKERARMEKLCRQPRARNRDQLGNICGRDVPAAGRGPVSSDILSASDFPLRFIGTSIFNLQSLTHAHLPPATSSLLRPHASMFTHEFSEVSRTAAPSFPGSVLALSPGAAPPFFIRVSVSLYFFETFSF